jgi:LacI family transcriptional regulator
MKHASVTIKDIARELKISPSTVSRALKDHPDISPATKKAVRELAERLDYQPNSVALSLRKSKTNTIGVVVPQIVHHFFSTVISGIEDVALKAGYQVMVCNSGESYEREVKSVQALIGSRVDGLLISVAEETSNISHFESLIRRGVPVVFFDRTVNGLNTSEVVVDDFGGAYRAVQHLLKVGRNRILHLSGPASLNISEKRQKGYEKALNDAGHSVDKKLIAAGGLTIEEGEKAMEKFLATNKLPDAIFAANDPVAIGAMKYLKKKGISIPEQVAVVGFSNEPLTALIDPPLSTVAQPGYEMGTIATELLLQQIADEDKSEGSLTTQKKELRTELIIRGSSE